MTNALALFLDYPQLLIVIGTVVLMLGLLGLALFVPSGAESIEDRLSERPRSFDEEYYEAPKNKQLKQLRGP
jgi:hypothetical protein